MDDISQIRQALPANETTFLLKFAALEQDLMTLLGSGETDKAYQCVDTFAQHGQELIAAADGQFLTRCIYSLVGSLAANGIVRASNAVDFAVLENYLFIKDAKQPVTSDKFVARVRATIRDFAQFTPDEAQYVRPDSLCKDVQRIVNYVDAHRYDKLTPRGVVQELDLKFDFVSRQFKRETGLSITAYIRRTKMHEAKHLLLSTDISVNTIADMLGYYDTANFTKRFHAEYSVPPSIYREINQVTGKPGY